MKKWVIGVDVFSYTTDIIGWWESATYYLINKLDTVNRYLEKLQSNYRQAVYIKVYNDWTKDVHKFINIRAKSKKKIED